MEQTHTARARFEAIYEQHFDAIVRWAFRRADPETARDVTAETFLIAWRRIDSVPDEDARVWLLTVAQNVLRNSRRAEERRSQIEAKLAGEPVAHVAGPADRAIDPELIAALRTLPEQDRELVLLTALEGLSTAEAGRVLGMSAPAARVRLHRLRRRIQAELGPPPSVGAIDASARPQEKTP